MVLFSVFHPQRKALRTPLGRHKSYRENTTTMESTQSGGALPPQAAVMQMVMGAWVSQTISSVTRLDIPDLLQQHGPLTASQLTSAHGVAASPEFLHRVLRACASAGIFTEDADGRFGPTPLSEVLTASSAASLKKLVEVFGGLWWRVWTGLPEALGEGAPQAKARLGMEYWDYLNAHPKDMEDFGEAMKSNSAASMLGVIEHCDFSSARKVVDVGGGLGHMAIELLRRNPQLTASVVDLEDLIPIAHKHAESVEPDVLARLSFVGGDMFADVPAGDRYILKHIIHDWDDDRCIRLLQNCRARMEGDGRVYCVDAVLPPLGNTAAGPSKFLDINIMLFIPGRERTEAEWRQLYYEAGLEVVSIVPLQDNFGTSIVEGTRR